jgi:hypothetical protein
MCDRARCVTARVRPLDVRRVRQGHPGVVPGATAGTHTRIHTHAHTRAAAPAHTPRQRHTACCQHTHTRARAHHVMARITRADAPHTTQTRQRTAHRVDRDKHELALVRGAGRPVVWCVAQCDDSGAVCQRGSRGCVGWRVPPQGTRDLRACCLRTARARPAPSHTQSGAQCPAPSRTRPAPPHTQPTARGATNEAGTAPRAPRHTPSLECLHDLGVGLEVSSLGHQQQLRDACVMCVMCVCVCVMCGRRGKVWAACWLVGSEACMLAGVRQRDPSVVQCK